METPVRVYTPDLELLGEVDRYGSLQFNPKFYEVGEFEFHINFHIPGAELFKKGNVIVIDKEGEKAMIIRKVELALDQQGRATENWKITGKTLDGVLDQRSTIPPDHTGYDRISGDAETVMKHYIDRNFINPDDPDRKIPQLEVAPNKNRGRDLSYESRFKNVAEEITTISKQGNLGWVVYADISRGKWVFDVIVPRDLTQGNEAGRRPVFFSPDFQTIESQEFVDSDENYKNVAIVAGQGEGVEREIVMVGEGKGLDRKEVFVDARDIGDEEEGEDGEREELPPEEVERRLRERGEAQLADEYRTEYFLEAQILTPAISGRRSRFAMRTPYEYGTDFRLGDIVQVFNRSWNLTMDAPITEFMEIHEPTGFELDATFGEAQPTLIDKIQREFNKLNDVDTQELPVRISTERMRDAMEYSDGQLSEEQQERIREAQENLNESLEYTDQQDEIYEQIAEDDASDKADDAERWARDHADEQDEYFDERAQEDATDKANDAERGANDYTDDTRDIIERDLESKPDYDYVDDGYDDLMEDIAAKADLEYVDDELRLKADSEALREIDDTVSDLSGTASDLLEAVDDHADELEANDGRITSVETDIDDVEGELSATITDLSDLDDTVSRQQVDIEANSDGLALKADQVELDSVSGDVSNLSGEINVLAGEVELKAEQSTVEGLQDDFYGLQVGGRNLLPNSDFSQGLSPWFVSNSTYSLDGNEITITSDEDGNWPRFHVTNNAIQNIKEGETYTLSFEAKGDIEGNRTWRISESNGSNELYRSGVINYTDEWQYFSETFTAEMDANEDVRLEFWIDEPSPSESNTRSFRNLKLEKGNRATDWTPAPEDVDAQFETVTNEVADLTVSVDGIEGNVSSLTQTVDDHGTEITDLDAEISAQADRIDQRVSISEYEADQDGVITRLDDAEATISNQGDMIESRVTQSSFDSLEDDVRSAESSITQHADKIESKIDDGEARSIFTQEADSFTFDADQINFEGHVFGEDATFEGRIEGATFVSEDPDNANNRMTIENNELHSEGIIDLSDVGEMNFETEISLGGISGTMYGGDEDARRWHIDISGFNFVNESVGSVTRLADYGISFGSRDEDSAYIYGESADMRPDDNSLIYVDADLITINGGEQISLNTDRTYFDGTAIITDDLIVNGYLDIGNGDITTGSEGTAINHTLTLYNAVGASGAPLRIGPYSAMISSSSGTGTLLMYGNRAGGNEPFRVRSHVNEGNYRNDFWIDSSSGRMTSPPTRNNPTTNSANMHVFSSTDRISHTTSSRAYKLAEEPVKVDPYRLLDVEPKDWYDKIELEDFSDDLTRQHLGGVSELDTLDISAIRRVPGIVAEDVQDAGLSQYVTYDREGEVDGLMYDRLWTLLIPIVKEQQKQIDQLKEAIQ